MSQPSLNQPLNSHQLEILKLFSRNLEDQDLIEIKRLIVKYLANKINNLVDDVWKDKKWDDTDAERLLQQHNRTPYNPHN